MKITDEILDNIAKLAQLRISEHERDKLKKDMTAILEWVDKLNEVETNSVEPMVHMSNEKNRVREDNNPGNLNMDDALKNASEFEKAFFVVPKVIEKGK